MLAFKKAPIDTRFIIRDGEKRLLFITKKGD